MASAFITTRAYTARIATTSTGTAILKLPRDPPWLDLREIYGTLTSCDHDDNDNNPRRLACRAPQSPAASHRPTRARPASDRSP